MDKPGHRQGGEKRISFELASTLLPTLKPPHIQTPQFSNFLPPPKFPDNNHSQKNGTTLRQDKTRQDKDFGFRQKYMTILVTLSFFVTILAVRQKLSIFGPIFEPSHGKAFSPAVFSARIQKKNTHPKCTPPPGSKQSGPSTGIFPKENA